MMKAFFLKLVNYFNLYSMFNGYTKDTATIFMLHRIAPEYENTAAGFSPALLREYFKYLKKNRYNVISLSSYMNALIEHKDTNKTVVFTVDDGYRNFYLNAFKIFQEFNYPATIFITSNFINNNLFFWWDTIEYAVMSTKKQMINLPEWNLNHIKINNDSQKTEAISYIVDFCKKLENSKKLNLIQKLLEILNIDVSRQPTNEYEPLSWKEIVEMNESEIEFHPHTKTHPIMTRISSAQKLEELSEPKIVIENKLGISANIFCYPNGGVDDFDEETINILKSLNYIGAVTGLPGFNNTKNQTDLFRVHRFALPSDPILFKQYICGLERAKRMLIGRLSHRYRQA